MKTLWAVKVVHTAIWAILAGCILSIPVLGMVEMYRPVLWLTGIVLMEVVVLGLNDWRCPLTVIAARHTKDRRGNFDIYLPEWIARNNRAVFGTIFVAGEALVLLRWRGYIG